ncbi:hypothetical protein [Legionella septentrionalis]|uniref:hypothetical protein n=1 Tax=Legionella septentrionalis TaxID=2498109 RepID=UPI000F8F1AEC|nr:hypothetical protein [Legionella septentrionalis]RUR10344.1 hypothetical protein ELY14_05590 [Legionella septentrionalis]RUR17058.1 hypothetical protein ELY10_01540 [Legionella septentrionalis]
MEKSKLDKKSEKSSTPRKESLKKIKKDDDLDEALEETFPASDATAKYQGETRVFPDLGNKK